MTMANKPTPLVSVIIATYNRADVIGETIQSILDQTSADFELLIVSDGCTDHTETVVAAFADQRIRFLRQLNSGRPAVPRNVGIREARGKYVAFCDDDDIWLPEKLERQLANFPEEGISCVATDYLPIGDVRFLNKSLHVPDGLSFRDFSYEDILFSMNPVVTSSVVARKDFLLDVQGFDEDPSFRFIEDWELWLRMSRKDRVRILAEPLLKYRMYRKVGRDARQVTLNSLKILQKHNQLGYLDDKSMKAARGNCSVVIGKAFLDFNDRRGIRYYLNGLFYSTTTSFRIRSFVGIILFLIPFEFKDFFLNKCVSFINSIRNR